MTGEKANLQSLAAETESEQARHALTASEQETARLYLGIPGIVFLMRVEPNNNYRFVAVSRMFVETTGLTADQIVGRTVHEVIPAPSQALVLAKYSEAIQTKATVQWEEVSTYPTGTLHCKVSVAPVFAASGACTHLAGIVHDLTELRRTEEVLRQTDARLRQIIDATPAALFTSEIHEPYRATFVSSTAKEQYGYEAQSFTEDPGFWASKIHPDDSANVVSRMREVLDSCDDVHIHEYRFCQPDGTYRWIHEELRIVRGASGAPIEIIGYGIDVTERKRNERMLRTSEERLSLAIEASSLGLWDWDIAADTAYLSPEYLRLSGYVNADVHPALAFFTSLVHPADLPQVERTMREHLQGKSQRSAIEYRMRKKSGEYFWVRGVGRVTTRDDNGAPTRMTGTITDITESRRLEEELRERQALLLEAERLAHLGHWDRDLRSGRSYWSNEIYRALGYAPGSVVPSPEAFLRAVHPEDRERIGEGVSATARDGVTRRAEYRVVDAHGAVRSLWGTVELLQDSSGVPARIIGTVQDITERKAAEVERERLVDALRETDRRKNEFLAVLSHELRNPLAPIKNSLYILDRAAPGGDQARRAQAVIDRQVDQLARLVDDLLDVTRISRNKMALQRQSLELNELVRRTMEDHRSLFEKNEIHVELVPAPQPVFINADWNRLAQVVGNLLQNAAKFTGRAGRVTVSVASDPTAGQATIHVADTGVGMTREMLSRLFQPFVQAESTLDRTRGGLGLGLALVKGLVELHGGEVTASSAGIGKGAEVVVHLPLELPQGAEPQPDHAGRERIKRRVLIIEDNFDAADSLREALELGGHEVEVAYNGPAGLAKAREFRPGIVFCDIELPAMDGYEVARAFQADEALKGVFLVALTGYARPEDLQRAQAAGFDRHIAKPPSLEKLEALLAEAPQRSTESQEADAPPPRH